MVNDTTGPATTPAGDALRARLEDPAIAASLIILLENTELLSTLVLGLNGFMQRSDMIMDAVAESVGELKTASEDRPAAVNDAIDTAKALAPGLHQLANSSILQPETIGFVDRISRAATEGAAAAARHSEPPSTIGLMKSLRDDDVRRGLDVMIEIARALGRHPAT